MGARELKKVVVTLSASTYTRMVDKASWSDLKEPGTYEGMATPDTVLGEEEEWRLTALELPPSSWHPPIEAVAVGELEDLDYKVFQWGPLPKVGLSEVESEKVKAPLK